MKRTLLAAVALVLATAGCSPSGDTAASKPSPTPSPAAFTATAIQYASALNGPIKSFQKESKKYDDDFCEIDNSSFTCQLEPMTMGLCAKLVSLDLTGLALPSSHTYVGPPPATMASLVASTISDADQVGADGEAKKLPDSFQSDVRALNSDLDEWGPYLHG